MLEGECGWGGEGGLQTRQRKGRRQPVLQSQTRARLWPGLPRNSGLRGTVSSSWILKPLWKVPNPHPQLLISWDQDLLFSPIPPAPLRRPSPQSPLRSPCPAHLVNPINEG